MKPTDVKTSTYIDIDLKNNNKDPKSEVRDHVRISKYNSIFAKGYTSIWFEKVFAIKEVKSNVPWTYVTNDFNGEKIVGKFHEKELHKPNQTKFSVEKVMRKKR